MGVEESRSKPASTGPAQRRRGRPNATALRRCHAPRPLAIADQSCLGQHLQVARHRDPRNRKVAAIWTVMAGRARNRPAGADGPDRPAPRHNDAVPASSGLVLCKKAPVM